MKLIQNNCLPVYHLQFFCWLHYETDPVETLRHIKRGVNIVSKTLVAVIFYLPYTFKWEPTLIVVRGDLILEFQPYCPGQASLRLLRKFRRALYRRRRRFPGRNEPITHYPSLYTLYALPALQKQPSLPVCDCSEQGKDIIRSARGKYVNILIEYQNVMYPTMTTRRKKDRIAKMLYFLTKEKVERDG